MKDYVKSEKSTKEHVQRFLSSPADDPEDLAERAAELASIRHKKGNLVGGIVFKEGIPLVHYPASACMDGAVPTGAEKTAVLNEWRLWYGAVLSEELGSGVATPLDFALMDACPNSFQNGDVVDHPTRREV